jgi:hypothetical protein
MPAQDSQGLRHHTLPEVFAEGEPPRRGRAAVEHHLQEELLTSQTSEVLKTSEVLTFVGMGVTIYRGPPGERSIMP